MRMFRPRTEVYGQADGNEVSSRSKCPFFFQAEDGIRDYKVTGVQTCALPIWRWSPPHSARACTRCSRQRRRGSEGAAAGHRRLPARRPAPLHCTAAAGPPTSQIGKAAWRGRVLISVGGVLFKKKTNDLRT